MWEALLASGLVAVIGERVADWIGRRRKASREELVRYIRLAFRQATHLAQLRHDADDQALVWHSFIKLLYKGLDAAGVKRDDDTDIIIAETFSQLWDVFARETLDNAFQELAKAGRRGERFADALMKESDPPHNRGVK